MEFDSYIDFYNYLKTFPFADIVLGVKDTIVKDTLYISLTDSKVIKMDNTSFAIGFTYGLVLSAEAVDSPLVQVLADCTQSGVNMVEWSENSHLYNYQASIYLPVGSSGEPWQ